jgi:hypothetical protein
MGSVVYDPQKNADPLRPLFYETQMVHGKCSVCSSTELNPAYSRVPQDCICRPMLYIFVDACICRPMLYIFVDACSMRLRWIVGRVVPHDHCSGIWPSLMVNDLLVVSNRTNTPHRCIMGEKWRQVGGAIGGRAHCNGWNGIDGTESNM